MILKEFLEHDSLPAMERVHRGQTVLHLCVKHRQVRALEFLMEEMAGEFMCAKDDDGDSILHWAVRSSQIEMIQCLAKSDKLYWQRKNSMGQTPWEIFIDTPRHRINNYSEIKRMLALTKFAMLEPLPEMTGIITVVVVLIATMAFQAAVSPPGGVWQDDSSTHKAGEAVMASTHPRMYKHFLRTNTTAFVSSFITIFLLSTGFLSKSMYAQGINVGVNSIYCSELWNFLDDDHSQYQNTITQHCDRDSSCCTVNLNRSFNGRGLFREEAVSDFENII